jgi:hypothetical protein
MNLTCNIDPKGRRLRAVLGAVWLVSAAGVTAVFWPMGWKGWLIVAGMALTAGFHFFEARKGWCAVRAMGIRTPV